MTARDRPPSCLRQGRVRGRTGQAAFLPAARAGAWPHGTGRFLACGKGGCVAARNRPLSCLRQERGFRFCIWGEACGRERMAHVSARLAAGRSCPLFKLVATPREGAVPPSNPPKGVRGRTGRAAFLPTARAGAWPHGTGRLLACRKGGRGLHPGRAAFLPAARARGSFLYLSGTIQA